MAREEARVQAPRIFLISRLDLPNQTAYEIVKTLKLSSRCLHRRDRRLSDISAGPDTYMPFPVHPGRPEIPRGVGGERRRDSTGRQARAPAGAFRVAAAPRAPRR